MLPAGKKEAGGGADPAVGVESEGVTRGGGRESIAALRAAKGEGLASQVTFGSGESVSLQLLSSQRPEKQSH